MILSPATPITPTIAHITRTESAVCLSFREHNDKFREAVKHAGYEWSERYTCWKRNLDPETTGSPLERAAEIAYILVNSGFIVDVDENVSQVVQAGAWGPECKRWVKCIGGKFHLRWRGSDENLYRRARMLPESEYDPVNKTVVIPPVYYAEVIGFAEEHEFKFTRMAEALIEQGRRDYKAVVPPELPAPKIENKVKIKARRVDSAKFRDYPVHNLSVRTSLYPHQIPAVDKIAGVTVGGLFMDMGTGKTRCAIELVYRRHQRISRVIWFCPVGLKLTIAAEIEKHTEGERVRIVGDGDAPLDSFWYVIGIETMSSSDRVVLLVNALMDDHAFVIVDESSYIKGASSKRTVRITELSRRARYRLLLTGTPLSQGIVDLYAQMRFLSPEILGFNSFYSFAHNHLEYSEKYPGMIVKSLNVDNLTQKIDPFVYQVTKDECLDLPEKLYDQVYYGLTDKQHEIYQRAKSEILDGIENEIPDYLIFHLFTALQQIVAGYWNRDGEMIEIEHHRIDVLRNTLESIPDGKKVIVWCKFVYSLNQIASALPGAALYYGNLDEHKRASELARFRGPDCRYLIATQSTGGHGLTLNEAKYHVFYENGFKYSERAQAEDRSHRIGQTEPVTYIDIISNSGIDAHIQRALGKKQNAVKLFRDEMKKNGRMDL